MDSYEINKNTVALIPKENKTIVYEVDNSIFLVVLSVFIYIWYVYNSIFNNR